MKPIHCQNFPKVFRNYEVLLWEKCFKLKKHYLPMPSLDSDNFTLATEIQPAMKMFINFQDWVDCEVPQRPGL